MMENALETSADTIIFDLEDAVPNSKIGEARDNIRAVISSGIPRKQRIGVRINGIGSDYWLQDIMMSVDAKIDVIWIPKVESPYDIHLIAETAKQFKDNLPYFGIILESPFGFQNGEEIAVKCREYKCFKFIDFGIADYCRGIGANNFPVSVRDYLSHQAIGFSTIGDLTASASVYLDIDDKDGLRTQAKKAHNLGFSGMSAIHPSQLDIINNVFTPSEEEIDKARRLVDEYDSSSKNSITVEGVFLDTATVDRYRDILREYEQVGEGGSES